ncbi:MAG: hypothetical protein U9N87_05835, partial [Planctomycetota bacterium]|nr:hypothetical protein [Planctomycetota bacterium]
AACCLFLLGCGQDLDLVPVSGKITLRGGLWPKPGLLRFVPVESAGDAALPTATADFQTDGHFVVSSPDAGDGLAPGTYRIAVYCWETPPVYGPGKSFIPKNYTDPATSGLELVVASGSGPVEVSYDIPRN